MTVRTASRSMHDGLSSTRAAVHRVRATEPSLSYPSPQSTEVARGVCSEGYRLAGRHFGVPRPAEAMSRFDSMLMNCGAMAATGSRRMRNCMRIGPRSLLRSSRGLFRKCAGDARRPGRRRAAHGARIAAPMPFAPTSSRSCRICTGVTKWRQRGGLRAHVRSVPPCRVQRGSIRCRSDAPKGCPWS